MYMVFQEMKYPKWFSAWPMKMKLMIDWFAQQPETEIEYSGDWEFLQSPKVGTSGKYVSLYIFIFTWSFIATYLMTNYYGCLRKLYKLPSASAVGHIRVETLGLYGIWKKTVMIRNVLVLLLSGMFQKHIPRPCIFVFLYFLNLKSYLLVRVIVTYFKITIGSTNTSIIFTWIFNLGFKVVSNWVILHHVYVCL